MRTWVHDPRPISRAIPLCNMYGACQVGCVLSLLRAWSAYGSWPYWERVPLGEVPENALSVHPLCRLTCILFQQVCAHVHTDLV